MYTLKKGKSLLGRLEELVVDGPDTVLGPGALDDERDVGLGRACARGGMLEGKGRQGTRAGFPSSPWLIIWTLIPRDPSTLKMRSSSSLLRWALQMSEMIDTPFLTVTSEMLSSSSMVFLSSLSTSSRVQICGWQQQSSHGQGASLRGGGGEAKGSKLVSDGRGL